MCQKKSFSKLGHHSANFRQHLIQEIWVRPHCNVIVAISERLPKNRNRLMVIRSPNKALLIPSYAQLRNDVWAIQRDFQLDSLSEFSDRIFQRNSEKTPRSRSPICCIRNMEEQIHWSMEF